MASIWLWSMRTASPTKIVYDPAEDDAFPAGMNIASSRTPSFSEDLGMLVFGIVEAEMTEEAKQRMERGDDQEREADEQHAFVAAFQQEPDSATSPVEPAAAGRGSLAVESKGAAQGS